MGCGSATTSCNNYSSNMINIMLDHLRLTWSKLILFASVINTGVLLKIHNNTLLINDVEPTTKFKKLQLITHDIYVYVLCS